MNDKSTTNEIMFLLDTFIAERKDRMAECNKFRKINNDLAPQLRILLRLRHEIKSYILESD